MESLTLGKSQSSYTPRQVKGVLRELGIKIEGETSNDYTCLCPFHGNRDTPAMTVSLTKGVYNCFSPQCAVSGSLIGLVRNIKNLNEFEARRLIARHGVVSQEDFDKDFEESMKIEPTFQQFDRELLLGLKQNLWSPEHPEGLEYMHSRSFKDETLDTFNIGYSYKRRTVTVPVCAPNGLEIGFIGRRIDRKEFDNSWRLLKSQTLFNIHRARRHSTAYVTEASFCAMRVEQAGFPGAVAIAGGDISQRQVHLLNMYFDRIVILTDFDDKDLPSHKKLNCKRCPPPRCLGHNPGRDLGNHIAQKLSHKEILWGTYEPGIVYPSGKDPSDHTDEQIAQIIENATPNYVYQQWELY